MLSSSHSPLTVSRVSFVLCNQAPLTLWTIPELASVGMSVEQVCHHTLPSADLFTTTHTRPVRARPQESLTNVAMFISISHFSTNCRRSSGA